MDQFEMSEPKLLTAVIPPACWTFQVIRALNPVLVDHIFAQVII